MNQEFEGLTPDGPGEPVPDWRPLLKWGTVISIVLLVFVNLVAEVIPPLVVFAVLMLIGLVWLRRGTKGPVILLMITHALHIILGLPFVAPTLAVPSSAGDFIVNVGLLLAGLTAFAAAIRVLLRRPGSAEAPKKLGRAAVALFVLAAAFSVYSFVRYEDATAQEGDIRLTTENLEFNESTLETQGGEVSVYLNNADDTVHTFTIDELGVNLGVPASGSGRTTFQAEPGRYEFYCAPHREDMKGVLYVD